MVQNPLATTPTRAAAGPSPTPRSELDRRLGRLQTALQAEGLDGALLHGVTNLFYYSGTAQQSHLWVPTQGRPVLLVRRVLERARRESALEVVEPLTSLRQLPAALGPVKRIGMELDILPVALFQQYQRLLPGVEVVDIGPATGAIRAVKSPYEVDLIREAAHVADATYRQVLAALKEGLTELELAIVAEAASRRLGFQGVVRWRAATGFECPWVHLLAGESALAFSFPDTPFGGEGLTPAAPYGPGRRVIGRGMPVCLDFATATQGYLHDMTRTMAVGPLDQRLTAAYAVCQEVLAEAEATVRPGVAAQEVWDRSLAIAARHRLEEHFMGWEGSRARFVGHGVGLELDEQPVLAPRRAEPLQVGNVIALEPKFFFPGQGAVGLEHTYLVTETGLERLTTADDGLAILP